MTLSPSCEPTPEELTDLKNKRTIELIEQEIDFFEKTVTAMAAVSKEYHNRITNAKTNTKKVLYNKKLKKNNLMLGELLLELEKAINVKKSIEQTLQTEQLSSETT